MSLCTTALPFWEWHVLCPFSNFWLDLPAGHQHWAGLGLILRACDEHLFTPLPVPVSSFNGYPESQTIGIEDLGSSGRMVWNLTFAAEEVKQSHQPNKRIGGLCVIFWRQIWRVAGRESGSPELLGSPRTSPEVPQTSLEVFLRLPRKFSHCGT